MSGAKTFWKRILGSLIMVASTVFPAAIGGEAIDIGSRRELFVDDYLIEKMDGCELRLHHPVPREAVMEFDKPWEGNRSTYCTVFRDGEIYRMYYGGMDYTIDAKKKVQPSHAPVTCYAESGDGIHWEKTELDLYPFGDAEKTNIVFMDTKMANNCDSLLVVFKDDNPDCSEDARYKALLGSQREKPVKGLYPGDRYNPKGCLLPMKSPDGIHWTRMSDEPLPLVGRMDSQNLAFWDETRQEYRIYYRTMYTWKDLPFRKVSTAVSRDFIHWTGVEVIECPGAPRAQLYTNQITAYPRAPHLFVGFPARYADPGHVRWQEQSDWLELHNHLPGLEERKKRFNAGHGHHTRVGTALTDSLFMTSRDGKTFKRWPQAFLRPGPASWAYADNFIAWQLVETDSVFEGAPRELSLYASEASWAGKPSRLRRYTLRLDGFVSVHSAGGQGKMVTKPFVFRGKCLMLNCATSIAGGIRVEIQDENGVPLPGFALADCPLILDDSTDRLVAWNGGTHLGKLAGRPIRLHFELSDADLYAMRFAPEIPDIPFTPNKETHARAAAATANRMLGNVLKAISTEENGPSATERFQVTIRNRLDKALGESNINRPDYSEQIRLIWNSALSRIMGVPRLKTAPEIDGKLEENAWQEARTVNLLRFDNQTGEGKPPEYPSELKVGYDAENLYLGFMNAEKDVSQLIALSKERGGKVWRDDSVEFGLQDSAETDHIHIIVNSLKTIFARRAGDSSWSCRPGIGVNRDNARNCWAVEIALPWKALGIQPEAGKVLRANFLRNNIRHSGQDWLKEREYSLWAPAPWGFNEPSCYGILILE